MGVTFANAHKFPEGDTINDGFNIRQLSYYTGSIIMKSRVDCMIFGHLRPHNWTRNATLITRVIVRPYGISIGSRQGPTTDTSV